MADYTYTSHLQNAHDFNIDRLHIGDSTSTVNNYHTILSKGPLESERLGPK